MSIVEMSAVLGNFGEFIGAVAVVITLIYLAVQVRLNTGAIRSSNAATIQINLQSLAHEPISDREFGDILIRAMSGEEKLEPAEKLAAYAWFFILAKSGELAYSNYLSGDLDEEFWHGALNFYRAYWLSPGFKSFWIDRRMTFTPAFRSAVEKWIAEESSPAARADKLYAMKGANI